jgi:hypothetical protein
MNVPIHALTANLDANVNLGVFAQERHTYMFKLYSNSVFGRFESPARVMFAGEILFCDDCRRFHAVDAESVLTMLYKCFRKVDDASL